MSKLDLAIVLIAVAGGAFWIEQGHRVVIDAPATETTSGAAACPDNDNVPYSAACLKYLNVSTERAVHLRVVATVAPPAPCPDNDRLPYSPSCIAFLKDVAETGMRSRVIGDPASIPAPQ